MFKFFSITLTLSLETSDYTHTHTLSDTVSPHVLLTGVAHLAAANAEEAATSLSSSCTSSLNNFLCLKKFNNPNPDELICFPLTSSLAPSNWIDFELQWRLQWLECLISSYLQ